MTNVSWMTVEDRMIQAESTLRRLPEEQLRGIRCCLPEVVQEWSDHGWRTTKVKIRPNGRDIDAMRIAMEWLLWIPVLDRRIVWGRAEMKRWERLAGENGIDVRQAQLCWQAGLIAIAHRLSCGVRAGVVASFVISGRPETTNHATA